MFGYVTASMGELSKEQQRRYSAVYCGICRRIREQSGQLARLGLSYDMAFLAVLLMSLYEPSEQGGNNGCLIHPITRRDWIDNEFVRYAADMNVALAYKIKLSWKSSWNTGKKNIDIETSIGSFLL